MSCLYILEIKPLLVSSFANIFSQSIGCLFVFQLRFKNVLFNSGNTVFGIMSERLLKKGQNENETLMLLDLCSIITQSQLAEPTTLCEAKTTYTLIYAHTYTERGRGPCEPVGQTIQRREERGWD